MTERRATLALLVALAACGDRRLPGQPPPEPEVPDPRKVVDLDVLFGQHCAGCHGTLGRGGPALALAAPGYLATAGDDVIRQVIANGRPGTAMPAFAVSAGGPLSDEQVEAIVRGMRAWASEGLAPDPGTPPYLATAPGDPQRGAQVFRDHCGSCHGADGRGGPGASSIVDGAYLALVSDQSLRTTIIAGRPDLGSPDWRGGASGRPMSAQDVSDTVAWLAAQREPSPGQPYPSGSRP